MICVACGGSGYRLVSGSPFRTSRCGDCTGGGIHARDFKMRRDEIDWYGARWMVRHPHESEVPSTGSWRRALARCRLWDCRDDYEFPTT